MKDKKFYTHAELHDQWMKDPEYRGEFNKLEAEYQIARQMIDARMKQKLTQAELAKRVGTGQAVISRLEGMNAKPSTALLYRVAKALNTKITVTFG